MKKIILLLIVILFTGCGYKVIKKQEFNTLTKFNSCQKEKAEINALYNNLDALEETLFMTINGDLREYNKRFNE